MDNHRPQQTFRVLRRIVRVIPRSPVLIRLKPIPFPLSLSIPVRSREKKGGVSYVKVAFGAMGHC